MKLIHTLLLAILCIGMAGIASAEVTTIAPGGAVFVGEEGLTLQSATATPIEAGTFLSWYAPGDTPGVSAPAATYVCQGAGYEMIAPATFQSRTGNWYLGATATPVINVIMPAIDVKAYNSITGEDMTNERVIQDNAYITFRLDSNLYEGILSRPNYAPGDATGIKVVVIDGEGMTYTTLFNDETEATTSALTNLAPVVSQYYVPGVPQAGSVVDANWALDRAEYKAGVYTFYAQVNLNGAMDNIGSVTGVTKTAICTVEVGENYVRIEANKDTVVQNNDFSVTINGLPNEYYVLWVKGTSSVTAPDTAPYIKPNQDNVFAAATAAGDNAALYQFSAGQSVAADVCAVGANDYFAMVKLSSNGTCTVDFDTDETTKNQTYTIRTDYYGNEAAATVEPAVAVVASNPTNDTTVVNIETGCFTIDSPDDELYYFGEEIAISGTNDYTNETWLFLKGANLASNGVLLINPQTSVVTGGTTSAGYPWSGETVENDSTWQFIWNTKGISLDPGTYTIYAITTPTAYSDLESMGADYSFTTLTLTEPQLTATIPYRSYITGEEIPITGTATGNPTQGVMIWILGSNYRSVSSESVTENGSFSYTFNSTYFSEGEYTAFVQHPMGNDMFDIVVQSNNPSASQTSVVRPILDCSLANPYGLLPPRFVFSGPGSLTYPVVADALEAELSAPAIDDTYIRETFLVGPPWITIDAIPGIYQGDIARITGETNLPAGDSIIISAGLSGTDSTAFSGNAVVAEGGGFNNTWSFDLDTTGWVAGSYNLTAASVNPEVETRSEFTLLECEPSVLSITVPLSPGWNLISVPVENATIITDGSLYPTVYCYNSSLATYREAPLASMSATSGYWVGSYAEANITFTGDVMNEYSVPADSGWNIIGSVSLDTPCTCIQPDVGSVTSVYAYDSEGRVYYSPGTITPGSGNWVNAAEDCNLTVTITPPSPPA